MTKQGEVARAEIRINNRAETTRYKGEDKMDADAFLQREHTAEVLKDVVDGEPQLWYGGICMARHKRQKLDAGDTIRFKMEIKDR